MYDFNAIDAGLLSPLMAVNDKDFSTMYTENANTTCSNVCADCKECILNEYNYLDATPGYNDKGESIIVACKAKNYYNG